MRRHSQDRDEARPHRQDRGGVRRHSQDRDEARPHRQDRGGVRRHSQDRDEAQRRVLTALAALAAAAAGLVAVDALGAVDALAAPPTGTVTMGFDDADRDVAFGVDNCGDRLGLTTTSSGVISGSHSGRTGVLTQTASNDLVTTRLRVVPGTTTVSITQRFTGPTSVTPVVEVTAEGGGTTRSLGTASLTTSSSTATFPTPADLPEVVSLTLAWRNPVVNLGQRAIFDDLVVTSARQATSADPPAGALGSAGCAAESPPQLSPLTSGTLTVPVGGSATLSVLVDNPNLRSTTLDGDLDVAVPGPLSLQAVGGDCGAGALSLGPGGAARLPDGSVLPAGGCRLDLTLTATTTGVTTLSLVAGALTTETGSSAAVSVPIEAVPPPAPTALADAVSVPAGGRATTSLLANDAASAPAALDPASVDLDPAAPGQQVSTVTGPFELAVDGDGVLTVVSRSAGPPLATASAAYTVADTFGTPSASASVSVADVAPAPPRVSADDAAGPAGATLHVDLLGNDSASAPARLDATSVDLDPQQPGRQTRIRTGGVSAVVDTSGTLTVVAHRPGRWAVPYTVADTFGTRSEPGVLSVAVAERSGQSLAATGSPADDLAHASGVLLATGGALVQATARRPHHATTLAPYRAVSRSSHHRSSPPPRRPRRPTPRPSRCPAPLGQTSRRRRS